MPALAFFPSDEPKGVHRPHVYNLHIQKCPETRLVCFQFCELELGLDNLLYGRWKRVYKSGYPLRPQPQSASISGLDPSRLHSSDYNIMCTQYTQCVAFFVRITINCHFQGAVSRFLRRRESGHCCADKAKYGKNGIRRYRNKRV